MGLPAIQAKPLFCAPPRPTDLRSTPRADDQGGFRRAAMGDALAFAFSDRLGSSSTESRIDTPLSCIGKEYSQKA